MKIAAMVRGYIPAPRPADMVYAPIDLAVSITEGLAKLGHDVTYYGPKGTNLNIPTENCGLRPLASDNKSFQDILHNTDMLMHYVPMLWDLKLARAMFERAESGEYDLLYFHHPEVAYPFAVKYPDVPVVYTVHDPLYDWYEESLELYKTPNQYRISISNNQRKGAENIEFIDTVYNGVDTDAFPYTEKAGDYLLFAGRIVPEKGVKEAVEIARRSGEKLIIAGPVFPNSQKYFNKFVKPFLNDKIKYVGYIARDKLADYYKNAKALLFPLQWEEPFGLTLIEAMACGTPVIALRRGSIPEVVEHGKTGFVVDSVNEMVLALQDINKIKRADCRAHVCKNFTIDTMVHGYEEAFKKVLKHSKKNGAA